MTERSIDDIMLDQYFSLKDGLVPVLRIARDLPPQHPHFTDVVLYDREGDGTCSYVAKDPQFYYLCLLPDGHDGPHCGLEPSLGLEFIVE